jgi:hypothetical protein
MRSSPPSFGILALAGAAIVLVGACARREPPSPAAASASVSPLLPVEASLRPDAETLAAKGADSGSAPELGARANADAAPGAAPGAQVSHVSQESDAGSDAGLDPSRLPQTREVPHAEGAAWEARVAALWDGIVKDDPERALPFFFPLGAYEQVKAIANPAADWRRRLVAAYTRDIHELHKKLGADPQNARFVRFEVGPSPRWVEPGEEYNKVGYYRVFGSKLHFARAGSAPNEKGAAFDVRSLISWRGEWYVVHLSAIK